MNTNKLISAIQSFADRLRNDDRSSIMFEADWDTLMEAKTLLRQLQAENEALKRRNEATALLNYNKGYEDGSNLAIPRPVKELTDEEITAIWQTDECYQNAQAFAKAILRKASEK